MTLEEILAACAGVVDVSIDTAARDFDAVLERVRSLTPEARATLRASLRVAIDEAARNLREAHREVERRQQDIDRWRAHRESAAGDPTLAADADRRIAELLRTRDLEANEYRASLDALQRALEVVDRK